MSKFVLSERSLRRLDGVDDRLVRVVMQAISATGVDFAVIEGVRTLERQAYLVERGASSTMHSRHLTGHAVDLVPLIGGRARWDWPSFELLAPFVKRAALTVGVRVEWGGDWKTFRDGPHWQVPWSDAA